MADWRRKLDVSLDEGPVPTMDGERGLVGHMTMETYDRLRNGQACTWCYSVLPDWPCAANWWRYKAADWNIPYRSQNEIRSLVERGCCPVCGGEVTREVFDAQFSMGEEMTAA